MKISFPILVIAALLLGLMYWQRPRPPLVQVARQPRQPESFAVKAASPLSANARKGRHLASSTNHVEQIQPAGASTNSLPVSPESLPEHLRVFLTKPKYFSGADLVAQLSAKDQPVLVQLYQQTTNLVDRNALTIALGLIGDEEVVALFKNALLQEHAGKELTAGYPSETDEEYVLFNTVIALGFLSARYDSAYSFVKQGTDPWFWNDRVQWTSSRGIETAGMLTSYSIQAVGQSGRSDVPQILEQFKTKDLVNRVGGDSPFARNFSGAVVDAAFYYDIIQQYGMESFRRNIFTENNRRLYQQWKETENGKKWRAWDKVAGRQK